MRRATSAWTASTNDFMSRHPLMRRNERCASIMPVPTQRRTMAGSRQRLTPEETRRTVEIIDSWVILSRRDIHVPDVQVCDLDGVFDAVSQDGPRAAEIFSVGSCF